jgi:hypothetical protein
MRVKFSHLACCFLAEPPGTLGRHPPARRTLPCSSTRACTVLPSSLSGHCHCTLHFFANARNRGMRNTCQRAPTRRTCCMHAAMLQRVHARPLCPLCRDTASTHFLRRCKKQVHAQHLPEGTYKKYMHAAMLQHVHARPLCPVCHDLSVAHSQGAPGVY